MKVFILIKGDHSYEFRLDHTLRSVRALMEHFNEMEKDPELNFDRYDCMLATDALHMMVKDEETWTE